VRNTAVTQPEVITVDKPAAVGKSSLASNAYFQHLMLMYSLPTWDGKGRVWLKPGVIRLLEAFRRNRAYP
jgi:hypothetical protein